jgi:hypothetical protein
MNGLIKWGAFVVELCLLIVLLTCVSVCLCSPSREYISQIVLLAIGAGACAYLSSSLFQHSLSEPHATVKQLLLEPPVAIWIFSMVFLAAQLTNHGFNPANHGYILYRIK